MLIYKIISACLLPLLTSKINSCYVKELNRELEIWKG